MVYSKYKYILLFLCLFTCWEDHTGKTETPAILSTIGATMGCDKIGPIIGNDLRNWTIIPKKSPNKPKMPTVSIMNPTKVHLIKIRSIPVIKHKDPRLFVGLLKNTVVFCKPIINTTPIKNNILPRANNALSKKVMIPNRKNPNPPKVNATPNSTYD